jgi:hypothetical protein
MSETSELLQKASFVMEQSDDVCAYSDRHDIHSAAILTVCDDELAAGIARMIAPRIEGKTVVEIGGGIGILAFHLGRYAKRVWCIEANPIWSSVFIELLFAHKPKNVSYLFGAADEFAGQIQADVAVFATHSGIDAMKKAGRLFAPHVVDIYGEMIADKPDAFDPLARALRPYA